MKNNTPSFITDCITKNDSTQAFVFPFRIGNAAGIWICPASGQGTGAKCAVGANALAPGYAWHADGGQFASALSGGICIYSSCRGTRGFIADGNAGGASTAAVRSRKHDRPPHERRCLCFHHSRRSHPCVCSMGPQRRSSPEWQYRALFQVRNQAQGLFIKRLAISPPQNALCPLECTQNPLRSSAKFLPPAFQISHFSRFCQRLRFRKVLSFRLSVLQDPCAKPCNAQSTAGFLPTLTRSTLGNRSRHDSLKENSARYSLGEIP